MRRYRIFAVIPRAGTLTSSTKSFVWHNNLYRSLVKMGHDVELLDFDYDEFFTHAQSDGWLGQHRGRFGAALGEAFAAGQARGRFDLVFAYLCDGFVDPEVIAQIRAAGVPFVNYSCNNIHQFGLVERISRLVDCNVYAEAGAAEKFAALGVPAVQMQMAADPDFYHREARPAQLDVSFVGQRYADRGELVAGLIRAGIDAHAFGPRWQGGAEAVGNTTFAARWDKFRSMARAEGVGFALDFVRSKLVRRIQERREDQVLAGHTHGILTDEAMVDVFATSRINLGFATVYAGGKGAGEEMYHLRLRDFEVPMAGGFYLTRYTAELEEYFVIGREIECYRSTEELVEKCRHYLAHPNERESIRQAGQRRCLADHTWERRFTKLFAEPLIQSLLVRREGLS
jgi:spore maturation protein CgeB